MAVSIKKKNFVLFPLLLSSIRIDYSILGVVFSEIPLVHFSTYVAVNVGYVGWMMSDALIQCRIELMQLMQVAEHFDIRGSSKRCTSTQKKKERG